jgi:proteasome accessory factor B
VKIWFDADQARWIREQNWPEGYQLKELGEGQASLRFETGGLEGVKMWVMKHGAHAEVLSPPDLRAEGTEELRQAVGRYE